MSANGRFGYSLGLWRKDDRKENSRKRRELPRKKEYQREQKREYNQILRIIRENQSKSEERKDRIIIKRIIRINVGTRMKHEL